MNIAELPDDSDTSDEDYIPGKKPEEVVSEVESDGDPEDPLSENEDFGKQSKKRKKKGTKTRKKLKPSANFDDRDKSISEAVGENEEEKKKRADLLWASFMKDTGFKSKTTQSESSSTQDNKQTSRSLVENAAPVQKPVEKLKVTKVFNFAGEEVVVEKEVPANSAEARLAQKPSGSEACKLPGKSPKGLGGIGSVLNQLGKKQKISTLEKSKLDWEKYKKEAQIEEELSTYNKGKDGYLERQDFLQRADLRRFEIEKEIRNIERSKRMDNVL